MAASAHPRLHHPVLSSTYAPLIRNPGASPRCPSRRGHLLLRQCRRGVAVAAAGASAATAEEADVAVAIIGAGVAGLATAVALHRLGIQAVVYEASPGLREGGAALSMWGNAWRALDALGVGHKLRPSYVPLSRVQIMSSTGKLLRSFLLSECASGPFGAHEVRGVERARLLGVLREELPLGAVEYGKRVRGVREEEQGAVHVQFEDGSGVRSRVVLGCDGAHSSLSSSLGLPPLRYSGYVAARGLAHVSLPSPHGRAPPEEGADISMVWGRGVRAGVYPLTPSLVYWFTCANYHNHTSAFAQLGEVKQSKEAQKEAALQSVKGWKGAIQDVIGATPAANIVTSPISDRILLPCLPGSRVGRGRVSLAGDALHPMTPNLGQGACTALEDAVLFARSLASVATDSGGSDPSAVLQDSRLVEAALRQYEQRRVQRAWPLVLRSNAIGALLQIENPLVCAVRDEVVLPHLFSPTHFLDHALFDCGTLPLPSPQS